MGDTGMVATIIVLALWAVIMGCCVAGGLLHPAALDGEDTEPVNWRRWEYVDREFRAVKAERAEWPTYRIGEETP